MRTLQAVVARTLFEQVNWPLHREQNAGGPAPCARVLRNSNDALSFFISCLSFAGRSAFSETVFAEVLCFCASYHVPVLI
jgi:hypothetical protein